MVNIPVEPAITEYLHIKAAKNRIPLSGTFELTPVCNMDCRMCYVRMSKAQQEAIHPLKTAKEWLALAEEAKKEGLLYLLLTGGEPFLRPDFREIMEGLHRMGFLISINSNGTMIDEHIIAWLKEVPPTRINITLYGASDETYARLCGNPKGYTQATKAIRLLKEAGITVKINCSLTPYNADDLEDILLYTKKERLIVQPTAYMFPPLRKDSHMVGRNDRFTPEEAAYYSAKIEYLLNGSQRYLDSMKKKDFPLPVDSCSTTDASEGDPVLCRAGKCSFWITWDGHMLPCGMLPDEEAPDVYEVGFQKAWLHAIHVIEGIRLPGKCKACPSKSNCKACAAMVYTESGNYHSVPEYRCQMARHYQKACQKVEEEILTGLADGSLNQAQEKEMIAWEKEVRAMWEGETL